MCHRCSREHWSPLEAVYVLLDVGSALVLLHCNIPLTASLLCHVGQDMGWQAQGQAMAPGPMWGVRRWRTGSPSPSSSGTEWVSWTLQVFAYIQHMVTWVTSE